MSSVNHDLLLTTSLLLTLLNILVPVTCVDVPLRASPKGLFLEDKIRLGSTPPSCHNRCNECNPCIAVQVPTLPTQPSPVHSSQLNAFQPLQGSPTYNQYSNYKPLGWKCRCGNRLFNP